MAAAAIITNLADIIREELSYVERRTEPEVDGIFLKMYNTSEGVERKGVGRAFKVIHTFSTGLAGAFKNVSALGDNMLDVARSGPQNLLMAVSETFPTVAESVMPGFVQKELSLVMGLGTFALPIHVMQADVLDATVAKVVALTIQGTAKKVAQSEAISFYGASSGPGATQAIITIPDAGVAIASGGLADATGYENTAVTIDVTDSAITSGRVANLMPGLMLDFWTSAGAQKNVSGGDLGEDTELIIGAVDYINGTAVIHSTVGAFEHDADGTDFKDGDYFTLRGSGGASAVGFGPSGPLYWLVNSGTIYTDINLTNFPQFKSVVTAVGGVLDSTVLNTNWGTFYDAYGSMNMIDSIITTAGVINQYIENVDGLFRWERSGAGALRLSEGWTQFDYTHQGMACELLISRYMPRQELWGMKLRNQNLKRYVPPTIPGVGKRGEFNQEIQWYAPLAGSKNIFLPARSSDAIALYVEGPFFNFREIAPEQIPGIRLTGLTELFTN